MCRQKELALRARKLHQLNEGLMGPPLKRFGEVVELIKSNEPNNLAKAERALDIYETQLRNLYLQKKAQQIQEKPVEKEKAVPKQTTKEKPIKLVTSPRPNSPPRGVKPTPTPLKSPVTVEITSTLSREASPGITTTTQPQTPLPEPRLQRKGVRQPSPPKKEIKPEPQIEIKPQRELTTGEKNGLVLMSSTNSLSYCGLSAEGQRRLVAAHNRHRRKFQQYDNGVQDLVWSAELAQKAQQYAEKLALSNSFAHSSNLGDVGENLANQSGGTTHGTETPEGVVNRWYNEIKDFDYPTLGPGNSGKMVGHFTQVISRRSTKVGCGVAKSATTLYEIWVCNYAPHGNMSINGIQQFLDPKKITSSVFETIKSQM
jgi:uncharacterized protein YkwD